MCPTLIAPSDVQCQYKVLNAETNPVDFTPNNSCSDPCGNKKMRSLITVKDLKDPSLNMLTCGVK